jgi:hypothetical protein
MYIIELSPLLIASSKKALQSALSLSSDRPAKARQYNQAPAELKTSLLV